MTYFEWVCTAFLALHLVLLRNGLFGIASHLHDIKKLMEGKSPD